MKKTIAFFSIFYFLFSSFSFGQKEPPTPPSVPTDSATGLITYSHKEETEPTLTSKELMARATKWYKKFYPNPTSVITKVDTVNMVIEGKAVFWTYKMLKGDVKATNLQIRYPFVMKFKQGKWKIEITGITVVAASNLPIEKLLDPKSDNVVTNYSALTDADTYFNNLLDDLKAAMKIPSVEVKKDDW